MTALVSAVQSTLSQAAAYAKETLRGVAPAVKKCAKIAAVALAAYAIAQQGGTPLHEAPSTALVRSAPPQARPDFTPAADPRYPRTEENRLPFEYRFMASQDYIDNVQEADLKEPVMWGIDARGRAYWSAKVVCYKSDGTTSKGVVTWFQRYTGEPRIVYGSHHMPKGCDSLGDLDPIYREKQFPQAMRRLLSGERVSANLLDHDGYSSDHQFQLDRSY